MGKPESVPQVAVGHERLDRLVCEGCGAVRAFTEPAIGRIQEEVARQRGFRLRRHRHELYGLCAGCRAGLSGGVGVA